MMVYTSHPTIKRPLVPLFLLLPSAALGVGLWRSALNVKKDVRYVVRSSPNSGCSHSIAYSTASVRLAHDYGLNPLVWGS